MNEQEMRIAIAEAVELAQFHDPMNMGALLGAFQHAHKAGYTGLEAQQAAWGLYAAQAENATISGFGEWKKKTAKIEELMRPTEKPLPAPTFCACCDAEAGAKRPPGASHGICTRHRADMADYMGDYGVSTPFRKSCPWPHEKMTLRLAAGHPKEMLA